MPKLRVALLLSIASLPMLLGGCVRATFKACPPLVTYSKQFQARAADELDALKPGARIGTMIVDYGKLRDACRVK